MIDRNRYRRKAIDIFDITQARGQAPHLGEKEKKISVSEKKKKGIADFFLLLILNPPIVSD